MYTREFLLNKAGFKAFEKEDRYAYAGASASAVIRHGNYVDYIWSEDSPFSVQGILQFYFGGEPVQGYFDIAAPRFTNWDALVMYIDETVYEALHRSTTEEATDYIKEVLQTLSYKLNDY